MKQVEIYFVTGNKDKFNEIGGVLKREGIKVKQTDLDLPEVKKGNDILNTAKAKAIMASKLLGKPVIYDDDGLFIKSLNDFPGINTAFAINTIGIEGILKLIRGKDRSAEFRSALAYADPEGRFKIVINSTKGKLSAKPKGSLKKHFQLDTLFIPARDTRTFSEMTIEEKNRYAKHNVQNAIELAKLLKSV